VIALQLLWPVRGTTLGARDTRARLVLYVGAQPLGLPAGRGRDVDVLHGQVLAGRGRAAVDAAGDVVAARTRHVDPAHVLDGQAARVAPVGAVDARRHVDGLVHIGHFDVGKGYVAHAAGAGVGLDPCWRTVNTRFGLFVRCRRSGNRRGGKR
jgi:hypothetical protein